MKTDSTVSNLDLLITIDNYIDYMDDEELILSFEYILETNLYICLESFNVSSDYAELSDIIVRKIFNNFYLINHVQLLDYDYHEMYFYKYRHDSLEFISNLHKKYNNINTNNISSSLILLKQLSELSFITKCFLHEMSTTEILQGYFYFKQQLTSISSEFVLKRYSNLINSIDDVIAKLNIYYRYLNAISEIPNGVKNTNKFEKFIQHKILFVNNTYKSTDKSIYVNMTESFNFLDTDKIAYLYMDMIVN